MGYAAVANIDDAIDTARAFLTPIDRGRWLRLAVVVFFLSGGASVGSFPNVAGQVSFGNEVRFDDRPAGDGMLPAISDEVWLLIGVVAATVLLLGLLFVALGSIMEFVLIDALRKDAVTVRSSFRRYARAGLSLFLFRLLLGLLVILPLGALGFALLAPALDGASAGRILGGLAIFVPVVLIVGLLAAVVHGLTVEFVAPVMVKESEGLLAAWRDFWPTLRGNLGEFAVYVLLRFGIAIAVSIVAGTVTGIVSVVVAIPFVILGAVVFFGTGGISLASGLLVAAVVVLFVLTVLAVSTVVQVPLKTYTRYYELLVLGDVEPGFDLIPDQRAAVRADDADGPGGAADLAG